MTDTKRGRHGGLLHVVLLQRGKHLDIRVRADLHGVRRVRQQVRLGVS